MPAINPALLAQGGNVLDAQKLLGGVQKFKATELLLQQRARDVQEFEANAPVRQAQRRSELESLEAESTILGAKALKARFDAVSQAQTPQQKLSAMSDMLDFLDTRAANIDARGGNPEDTIAAKNAVENYIANPQTGIGDLENVANLTTQLAEANIGGTEDTLLKTVENENGQTVNIYRSGRHEVTGTVAARSDYRYEAVKGFDAEGNEFTKIFRLDTTNRPSQSGDGTMVPSTRRIPVETANPQDFLSRLAPDQVTHIGEQAAPLTTQTDDVTTVTSPVEGIAAQESAKVGAKLTEERFNKVIQDAPAHTKMAGFIRQVSESVLRAGKKVQQIIIDNPNTATGFASRLFVKDTAEGGTIQKPIPFTDVDEASIQVDTLMNQVFGGAAFATLQQMRQASPTGGALGQVSNFEIDLLQNQWSAFSIRTDSEFAGKQIGEMLDQAQLVGDLANVEIAVQQRIQALGPDATKEEIAELINSGFRNMGDVYKRHGRDSGEWDEETLTWTPSKATVSGASNEDKKDALDLTQTEITTQEQYDALPSGAIYTEDGKTYRKP